jgi:hypothetical protein
VTLDFDHDGTDGGTREDIACRAQHILALRHANDDYA